MLKVDAERDGPLVRGPLGKLLAEEAAATRRHGVGRGGRGATAIAATSIAASLILAATYFLKPIDFGDFEASELVDLELVYVEDEIVGTMCNQFLSHRRKLQKKSAATVINIDKTNICIAIIIVWSRLVNGPRTKRTRYISRID